MDAALRAARIVESIGIAIPIAGTSLAVIGGSLAVILEAVKASKDEQEGYYELAIRAVELAEAMNSATKDNWDHLDNAVKDKISAIGNDLDTIGKFYQQYGKTPLLKKMIMRSKYKQTFTKFKNRLDAHLELLNLLVSTTMSAGVKEVHDIVRFQANQVDEPSHAVICHSFQRTDSLSNRRELDEEGLEIFSYSELMAGGEEDVQHILNYSTDCHGLPSETFKVPVTISIRLVKVNSKVYAVKRYASSDKDTAHKMFVHDKSVRLRAEYIHWVPKLVGTVAQGGSLPCEVFEMNSRRLYANVADLIWHYDPDTSNNIAILALLHLNSSFNAWQLLPDSHQCSIITNGPIGALEDLIVEIGLHDGVIGLKLVYTGEFVSIPPDGDFPGESWTRDDLWLACTDLSRNPLILPIMDRLRKRPFEPTKMLATVEPDTRLTDIAPLLLQNEFVGFVHYQKGFELSLGDIGYITPSGSYVILSNFPDVLWSPCWEVQDVSGDHVLCEFKPDKVHKFQLPENQNSLSIRVEVRHLINWNTLFSLTPTLRTDNSTTGTLGLHIVNKLSYRVTLHVSVFPRNDRVKSSPKPPVFVHAYIGNGSRPSFYLSLKETPNHTPEDPSKTSGTDVDDDNRLEWIMDLWKADYHTQPVSQFIPWQFLGIAYSPLLLLPEAYSSPDMRSIYKICRFWSSFLEAREIPFWTNKFEDSLDICYRLSTCKSENSLTFHFIPNPYLENSTFTLTIPQVGDSPKPLTGERIIWKKRNGDSQHKVIDRHHYDFYLYFLSKAHTFHILATHEGVSADLVYKPWDLEIGEPLRKFAKAVNRVNLALEDCGMSYDSVVPKSNSWWEESSEDGDWDVEYFDCKS